MSYREHFPDFDPATMPAIPAAWTDASSRNDACPFILASPSLGVFIDYADARLREFGDGLRFIIVRMQDSQHVTDARGATALATDDWAAVLAFIAAPGRSAYEADCAIRPLYPDGGPRKAWCDLGEFERWSWERNPTPREVRP